MHFKRCVFLLIFFFPISGFSIHNGDYLHKITTQYITPHLNWAKPLSGKGIKCLFLVPRHGAREVVELWQRLDINYDAFVAWWPGEIAKEDRYELSVEGTSINEKKAEILKKIKNDYDVIIVSIGFDSLPAEARYKIFEKVKNGTGLIFLNPNGKMDKIYKKVFQEKIEDKIFKGISLDLIPGFTISNYKIYKYGKGKIVFLRGGCEGYYSGYYNGLSLTIPRPYSRFWKFYYENNMVLIGKALLYAANRESFAYLESVNFQNGKIFNKEDFPFKANFLVIGNKQGNLSKIVFRIRDEWNEICFSQTINLSYQTDQPIVLNIPFLKEGNYTIDYIILDKNERCENFGFFTFKVNHNLGKIEIITQKDFYEKNEEIKGKILFENPTKENLEIFIKLVDAIDKKIWFQKSYEVVSGQKEIEFSIKQEEFPSLYGYIEGELIEGNKTLIKVEKGISLPKREMPLYPSFLWTFGCPTYPEFYYPQILKVGFDAVQEDPKIAEKFNLRVWPMVTKIFLWVNRKSVDEKKGWTNLIGIEKILPKYEDKIKEIDPNLDSKKIIEEGDLSFYHPVIKKIYAENFKNIAKNYLNYAPLYYNLGDENSYMGEGGYAPSEKKEFIKFLKEKYQKIENLNKEWNENFSNFEEVKHYFLEEIKKEKKYAAYYDHMFFITKEYADVHHTASSAIKEVDTSAYVGAEGSPSGNMEYMVNKLDVWGPYSDKIENELLRSLGKNKLRTIWWGGYVGTHGGRNEVPTPLWNYLLSDIVNGNSFFMAGPWSEGFLSVDLSYAEYFEKMFPHLLKLEYGIAQVLITNNLKNYGIAVLYSYPSTVISGFGEKKFISLKDSCSPFIDFCYRNGLNFDFLTPNMLEEGKLKDYKVLFLFGASSISLKEKGIIEDFVKNGGLVISDLNPGILNENCHLLEKIQLINLFPNLTTVEEFVNKDTEINKEIEGKNFNLYLKNFPCPSQGEIFQINKYGKGTAILLNFTLSNLLNTFNNSREFDEFLLKLLALRSIKKEIDIQHKGIIGRIAIRENPEFKILGFLVYTGDKGDTITTTLSQDKNFYIYQVDEGFFGQTNKIDVKAEFYPNLWLFSMFKEKQDKPKISVEKNIVKCGEKIKIVFSEKKKNRVYRIELYSGGNQIYKKVILSELKELEIPIAYNEIPGEYNLSVIDVITGLKEMIKITIEKG